MNLLVRAREALPVIGLGVLLIGIVALAFGYAPRLTSDRNQGAVSAAEVFTLTNGERADDGVPSLARNALLDAAAQMKARDMAAKGYYAHVSPEGLTPMHWVEQSGYRYLIIGENLVVNRTDAEQVVDAFMGSPGHRANILRKDFTEIGVGVANGIYKGRDATFAVQIFAAPYPGTKSVAAAPKASVKPNSAPDKVVAPSLAKTVAPKPVPRAGVVQGSTSVRGTTSPVTANPESIQEKVKTAIQPLFNHVVATSTASSSVASTTGFNVPSFSLTTSIPIELAGVSQLEANTLPIPIGSTWTMELRSFVEGVLLSARGLFVR